MSLWQEAVDIKSAVKPDQILMVVDAMTGQDIVNGDEAEHMSAFIDDRKRDHIVLRNVSRHFVFVFVRIYRNDVGGSVLPSVAIFGPPADRRKPRDSINPPVM